MLFFRDDINVYPLKYPHFQIRDTGFVDKVLIIEDERQKERNAQRNKQRETYENQVPENLPTPTPPAPTTTTTTTPTKRRRSDIPPAPVPDLMAPSAIQASINILPGAQAAAGKAISQTNRDIVANRKALRMGGNPAPAPTAVAENRSAADALRAEMGLPPAPAPLEGGPISAKA